MFRRLEPISPPPPNRHRSGTSAIPSIDEHDTSDADTNPDREDDEASSANKILKAPGALTPDAASLSASVSQSKRKRKPKRRLTLGKDPGGKWKRRKLQLEEQQIQKALEDDTDGEGGEEIFDCIKVAGGFLMRGPNAGQQPPYYPPPGTAKCPSPLLLPLITGGKSTATPATIEKLSKFTKKPTKPPRRKVKGGIKAKKQPTFIAQPFPKGVDESDSSSLSSLSELEEELGMKSVTANEKDAKGKSITEEGLAEVQVPTENSGMGVGKDNKALSGPASNAVLPVDGSNLDVPTSPPNGDPFNSEPVMEIPEIPDDTTMPQVNEDEAAGSPDSQPVGTPSPLKEQTVLQIRESQASTENGSPLTICDSLRTSPAAEEISEDLTKAQNKVSPQSMCAGGEDTSINPIVAQPVASGGPAKKPQQTDGDQPLVTYDPSILSSLKFTILKFPSNPKTLEITGGDISDPQTGQVSWPLLKSLIETQWGMNLATEWLLVNWWFRIRRQEDLDQCMEKLCKYGRTLHEIVLCELVRGKVLPDDAYSIIRKLKDQHAEFWKGKDDVSAKPGKAEKYVVGNGRELDGYRLNDSLKGHDDSSRVDNSRDTLMDVAEEPSGANPNTTLSNTQLPPPAATPNNDNNRRSTRQSSNSIHSLKKNGGRRWNLNAPTSLSGGDNNWSSEQSSSLGILKRSIAVSDKFSDGTSVKRRAIESKPTTTPSSRKTPASNVQSNSGSISPWRSGSRFQSWAASFLPSANRWRSGRSGNNVPTESPGGRHEPGVTPEASSDGASENEPITKATLSEPDPEPQSEAIQTPLVEKERISEPTPETSDSSALAEHPPPPGDEPVTPIEPGDTPEISASNSPQSSNGSKSAIRNRGRPRKVPLASGYSIAPSTEFNVLQQSMSPFLLSHHMLIFTAPKPPPPQTDPSAVLNTGQHAWRAVPHSSTVRAEKSAGIGSWRVVSANPSQLATTTPPAIIPMPPGWMTGWRAVSTQSKNPASSSSTEPSDSGATSTAQTSAPDKVALARNGSPGASGVSLPDDMDLDTPKKAPKSTESTDMSTASPSKSLGSTAAPTLPTGAPYQPPTVADKPELPAPSTTSGKEEVTAEKDPTPVAENTVTGIVGTDAASPTLETSTTPAAWSTATPATGEVSLPVVVADIKGDQQEVDDTRSEISSVVDMDKINESADLLLWAAMGGSPALAPPPISDTPESTTATEEPNQPAKKRKSLPRKKRATAKPRDKVKPPLRKSLIAVLKLSPQALRTIVKPDKAPSPPPTQPASQLPKPVEMQPARPSLPPPPPTASFTAVNIPRPQPYRRPEPTNDITTTTVPKSAAAPVITRPPMVPSPTTVPKPLPTLGSLQPPKDPTEAVNSAQAPKAPTPKAPTQSPKPIQPLKDPSQPASTMDALASARKKQEEQRRNSGRLDSLSSKPKPPQRPGPVIPRPAYAKPAASPPASNEKDGDETSTDEDVPSRHISTIPIIRPLGFPSLIAKEVPRPPAYVPKPRPGNATSSTDIPNNPPSGSSKMPPLVRPENFLYWDPNSAEKPQSKPPALSTTVGTKEWKLPIRKLPSLPPSIPHPLTPTSRTHRLTNPSTHSLFLRFPAGEHIPSTSRTPPTPSLKPSASSTPSKSDRNTLHDPPTGSARDQALRSGCRHRDGGREAAMGQAVRNGFFKSPLRQLPRGISRELVRTC